MEIISSFKADFSTKMQKKNISLLNFNTLGTTFFAPDIKKRYQAIAAQIKAMDIDLICFQEITTYYNLRLIKKYLRNYPYCHYKKHFIGPKGGLVIFSKLPIEKTSYHRYASLGSYKNITFYTRLIRNGILMCTLKDIPLVVMNTHLVSDFSFSEDENNVLYMLLKRQLYDAAEVVNTIQDKAVLLTGDFNMARDLSIYTTFLQKTGMKDYFTDKNTPTYDPKRIHYRFVGERAAIVDYIFLKHNTTKFDKIHTGHVFDQKVTLSNNKVTYLSDHIGLHMSCTMEY